MPRVLNKDSVQGSDQRVFLGPKQQIVLLLGQHDGVRSFFALAVPLDEEDCTFRPHSFNDWQKVI